MFDDSEDRPTTPCGESWAGSPEALVLEVQDASGTTRRPILEGQLRTVGSSRRAWLQVNDTAVSAYHCEFGLHNGVLHVRDLSSRNGTYAGVARIDHARCGIGTVLTLGTSSIMVRALTQPDSLEPTGEPLDGLIGGSWAMRKLADQVRRLASHDSPLLICGETGTGKELVAHATHALSHRHTRTYLPLNVASLPRELIDSELFGHERGAFTGAVMRKTGAFEEAAGGTLFLDEIGELPLESQPKLLRALDGYDVRRVGGGKVKQEARVVAATHVPLETAVSTGRFRRDLFHRLEVFVIRVPALRERPTDIGPIAKHFLRQHAKAVGDKSLTARALAFITSCPWPGNVRELRNTLLRAADRACKSQWIDVQDLFDTDPRANQERVELTPTMAREILERHQNNVSAAARATGYPRTTFRKMLSLR
jgi:transcriptional regulator with GAF, ATPase, and Fis domain